MPSISIDNCDEFSISVPPGSTFEGHKNTPCSSRLVNRQRPVPSQNTILMRLAFRPRLLLPAEQYVLCYPIAAGHLCKPRVRQHRLLEYFPFIHFAELRTPT